MIERRRTHTLGWRGRIADIAYPGSAVCSVVRVGVMLDRSDLEPIVLNQASAEIREQYMLSEKARKVLGWRPTYSLEDGLLETIEWYSCYFPEKERKVLVGSHGD